jgi:tetratricopeptide (TPR) repeat protein
MSEADRIYVLDTGSTDNTVELLKNRGAIVSVQSIVPWRFDEARNRSLDLVPAEADICVCTDLDETFNPGWRENLENAWTEGTSSARYIYNWRLKPDGSPDIQIFYFKIHARKGFIWRCPIHEYLECLLPNGNNYVFAEGVVLTHLPDISKSRAYYLELLETAVKESPMDARMNYYLGREYMYNKRWLDCISVLKNQLNLPTSFWKEERCASMRWIAHSYMNMGNYDSAYVWFQAAVSELPDMRDAYVECAQMAYSLADWQKCADYAENALKIDKKAFNFVNQGYAWDHTPHDLAAIANFNLGKLDKSLEHAQKALEISPGIERLDRNAKIIEKACVKKRLESSNIESGNPSE